MTVTNTSSKITYSGNGATTEFPIPFRFLDPSHIRVVLTSDEIDADTTNFTVSGSTLTYPASGPLLASGQKLTIMRWMDIEQGTQLENQGAYHPAVVEAALDERAMVDQQLQEQLDRTIKLPPSYAGGDTSDSNLALEILGARDRAEAAAGQAEGAVERAEEEADRAERAAGRADNAVVVAAEAAAGLMEDAVERVETAAGTAIDRVETAAGTATGQAETAAEQARHYAEQLTGLSIAVDSVPAGEVVSGSYNAETGMLTLRIPDGDGGAGGQPPISDSIDSPDSGVYASSKAVYDAARVASATAPHTHNAASDITDILPIANGGTGNTTGNAATATSATSATKLATARAIHVDLSSGSAATFDGTGDVTPGVTGILSYANGGNNNADGIALLATRLLNSRTIQTDLASSSWVPFNGSANIQPGVTGVLPISNGGTGASAASAARTNLGITETGSRGNPGWQKLLSGLIIQWGLVKTEIATDAYGTITFPLTFPTNCAAVIVNGMVPDSLTAGSTGTAAYYDAEYQIVNLPNRTQFKVFAQLYRTGGGIMPHLYYIAIGW